MLRIEFCQLTNGPTLKLEGRFVGDWAEHAKSLFTNAPVPAGLTIDLREVTYIDSVGERVLAWFRSIGAIFVAESSYTVDSCERLRLPLKPKDSSSYARRSGAGRKSSLSRQ